MPSPEVEPRPLGLRERKKMRTRTAIQEHALRLFAEQGYARTTVEQIADAAEVSQSTFFRYFPNKEEVVLYDDLDPLMAAAFQEQPRELSALQALRGAMHSVIARLPAGRWERELQRHALMRDVPELRAAMLAQLAATIELVAGIVGERTGRDPADFAVRTLAGALSGVAFSTMLATAEDPAANFTELMDRALIQLESGLDL